jgi:hypothetical protein
MTLDGSGVPQYPYIVGNYSKQKRTFAQNDSVYCTITGNKSSLTTGQTATITFTINKSTTTITSSDVTVTGGTLQDFSGNAKTYTATFVPTTNSTTNGTIYVAGNTFTDPAGNKNYESNTLTLSVDTASSTTITGTITSDKSSLTAGQTAAITFSLNASTTLFTSSYVNCTGGTLTDFSGSGINYTATFTPTTNSTTSGIISMSETNGSTIFTSNTLTLSINTTGVTKNYTVTKDEGPRADTNIAALGNLKPVFAADGSVTAGNSSQMSDGAAFVLIMSEEMVKELGVAPIARLVNYASAGVEPRIMGIGPVKAIPKALKQAGLTLNDIDLIELNEAFASQSLAVVRELDLNPEIVNVNGGAIALGHPLGCTGAKLSVQLFDEMKRRGSKYGIVSMCVGTGQGSAGIYEIL